MAKDEIAAIALIVLIGTFAAIIILNPTVPQNPSEANYFTATFQPTTTTLTPAYPLTKDTIQYLINQKEFKIEKLFSLTEITANIETLFEFFPESTLPEPKIYFQELGPYRVDFQLNDQQKYMMNQNPISDLMDAYARTMEINNATNATCGPSSMMLIQMLRRIRYDKSDVYHVVTKINSTMGHSFVMLTDNQGHFLVLDPLHCYGQDQIPLCILRDTIYYYKNKYLWSREKIYSSIKEIPAN